MIKCNCGGSQGSVWSSMDQYKIHLDMVKKRNLPPCLGYQVLDPAFEAAKHRVEDFDKAMRFNRGKPRMSLLSPIALEGLAKVFTYGAEKYADHNWRKGLPYSNYIDSLLRHLFAFMRGGDIDPESGLPHIDHVQWNAHALSEVQKTRPDLDDRYKIEHDVKWKIEPGKVILKHSAYPYTWMCECGDVMRAGTLHILKNAIEDHKVNVHEMNVEVE